MKTNNIEVLWSLDFLRLLGYIGFVYSAIYNWYPVHVFCALVVFDILTMIYGYFKCKDCCTEWTLEDIRRENKRGYGD